MIYSFLMLGQSNMAGRGDFGIVSEIVNPDILMLRDSGWVTMKEPINPDRTFSGIGLAASFADDYVITYGGQVGLIPCAEGASSLNQWVVNGNLYQHAIAYGRLAQKDSRIVGILWHQGENDSMSKEDAAAYVDKFTVFMDALVNELNIIDVPLILGELGEFVGRYNNGILPYFHDVNAALHHLAATRPHCAIASATGLRAREDGIHFDSPSFRKLGHRYFQQYKKIIEDHLP